MAGTGQSPHQVLRKAIERHQVAQATMREHAARLQAEKDQARAELQATIESQSGPDDGQDDGSGQAAGS